MSRCITTYGPLMTICKWGGRAVAEGALPGQTVTCAAALENMVFPRKQPSFAGWPGLRRMAMVRAV
jgi:hypothetical protein